MAERVPVREVEGGVGDQPTDAPKEGYEWYYHRRIRRWVEKPTSVAPGHSLTYYPGRGWRERKQNPPPSRKVKRTLTPPAEPEGPWERSATPSLDDSRGEPPTPPPSRARIRESRRRRAPPRRDYEEESSNDSELDDVSSRYISRGGGRGRENRRGSRPREVVHPEPIINNEQLMKVERISKKVKRRLRELKELQLAVAHTHAPGVGEVRAGASQPISAFGRPFAPPTLW